MCISLVKEKKLRKRPLKQNIIGKYKFYLATYYCYYLEFIKLFLRISYIILKI